METSYHHREHVSEDLNDDAKSGKQVRGFWALMNLMGGISGLASLLTVAVLWGAMRNQIDVNSHRLDNIEANGSPAVQTAIKILQAEVEARKDADAALSHRIEESRIDFNQRAQNITALLEKQVESQTALMSLIRAQQQVK